MLENTNKKPYKKYYTSIPVMNILDFENLKAP